MSATVDSSTARFVKAAAEFEQFKGYIRIESVMGLMALNHPAQYKKELNERNAELFRIADLGQPAELWNAFDAAHAAFWEKIEKLAPTWKRPPRKGGGAGAAAGKKTFKTLNKGNKVKAAYLTRAEWRIHKNPLGIPIRRTRPGYVVYKEKKNKRKWCTGRTFTYAEEYVGRRYKKARTVKEFGYIRYEKCK